MTLRIQCLPPIDQVDGKMPGIHMTPCAPPTAASQQRSQGQEAVAGIASPATLFLSKRKGRPNKLRGSSQSTVASRNKRGLPGPFRLLDLPAELRDLIYSFWVAQDSCAVRRLDFARPPAPVQGINWPSDLPSLLRTSHQLLAEAGAHYFIPTSTVCFVITRTSHDAQV